MEDEEDNLNEQKVKTEEGHALDQIQNLQEESEKLGDFNDYEYNVDNQLRTVTKSSNIDKNLLNFYKKNFTKFVRDGLEKLDELKKIEIIN